MKESDRTKKEFKLSTGNQEKKNQKQETKQKNETADLSHISHYIKCKWSNETN